MPDQRNLAFLLFALLVAAGQTAWIQFAPPGRDADGLRTGEPFVYLLPPVQPAVQAPDGPCADSDDEACATAPTGGKTAPAAGLTPPPDRKPATGLAASQTPEETAPAPAPATERAGAPVPLVPIHAFKDPEGDGFLVLGSYASRENAEHAARKFGAWDPLIVSSKGGGANLGRVVIGPFRPAVLPQVMARLDAEGIEGVWPVSRGELDLLEAAGRSRIQ